jgi:RimJ/RimL family protein N-acetyltransferase
VIVYGEDGQVAEWVALQIPDMAGTASPDSFGPCRAMGVVRRNELVGGVVFHDWQPKFKTIGLSGAAVSPMAALPGTVRALLAYPFHECGVHLVWAKCRFRNEGAARFLTGLGFIRDGVLRRRFGDDHEANWSLTRREYERKWTP